MREKAEYFQKKSNESSRFKLSILITSVISFIAMITNVVMKLILQENKFDFEQYKIMQKFYPEFKMHLLELKMVIQEVERNNIYKDMEERIKKCIVHNKTVTKCNPKV